MKDSIEKFEKKINVTGFKPIDFTDDSGHQIKICKLVYSYMGNGETEFGLQSKELNVDFSYVEKLKGCKFPLNIVITFSCENLTVRPKIEDIKILGVNG